MLAVLYWVFWGIRLKVLANALHPDIHVSSWEGTKIVMANMFLAGITPSMAGGEPIRIYLLNKDGLSVGEATAAVLGERMLDAMFLLVTVPFAFFIIKDYLVSYPIKFSLFNTPFEIDLIFLVLLIGIAVFLLLLVLFLLAVKYPEKAKVGLCAISRRINRLSKKKKESKMIDWISRNVDDFHNGMMYYFTRGRKAFLLAFGVTVIYWFIGFLIPSMILLGLGLPPYFIVSFAAQIVLIIIVMLPLTPGSSGVTEISVAGLYSLLIGSTMIGVFVILFRLITYYLNLVVGAIFQYRVFKSLTSFSLNALEKTAESPCEK